MIYCSLGFFFQQTGYSAADLYYSCRIPNDKTYNLVNNEFSLIPTDTVEVICNHYGINPSDIFHYIPGSMFPVLSKDNADFTVVPDPDLVDGHRKIHCRLNDVVKEKNLSGTNLSKMICYRYPSVLDLLHDEANYPSVTMVDRICRRLDVGFGDLFVMY